MEILMGVLVLALVYCVSRACYETICGINAKAQAKTELQKETFEEVK